MIRRYLEYRGHEICLQHIKSMAHPDILKMSSGKAISLRITELGPL